MKKSFTMIELIFVIVVIGILAAIALPKFSENLAQANITKAKSKVSAIRSALQVYKNKHILVGEEPYPDSLTDIKLFDVILPPGIDSGTNPGDWEKLNGENYKFYVDENKYAVFAYDKDNGSFKCDEESSNPGDICKNF